MEVLVKTTKEVCGRVVRGRGKSDDDWDGNERWRRESGGSMKD